MKYVLQELIGRLYLPMSIKQCSLIHLRKNYPKGFVFGWGCVSAEYVESKCGGQAKLPHYLKNTNMFAEPAADSSPQRKKMQPSPNRQPGQSPDRQPGQSPNRRPGLMHTTSRRLMAMPSGVQFTCNWQE